MEEAAGIKEMFQSMDINNTGRLTLEELKYGLHKQGHQIADADVKILMEAVSFIHDNILVFFFPSVCFILVGGVHHSKKQHICSYRAVLTIVMAG